MADSLTGGGCLLCGSVALEDVIELRPTPPANALASAVEEAERAVRFPLHLALHRVRARAASRPGQPRPAKDPSSWQPMGGGWTGMALGGSSAGSPAKRGSIRQWAVHTQARIHHRGARCWRPAA